MPKDSFPAPRRARIVSSSATTAQRAAAMCQLLGMNSSKPADLRFSFAGFAERGGRTGEHRDGWGIAFHTRRGWPLLLNSTPRTAWPGRRCAKRPRRKLRFFVVPRNKAFYACSPRRPWQ
eukprot:gene29920-33769_t